VEAVMKMKPILSAIIVILAVASLAAVGTYAAFSDIETSRDNYLETAELNLQLKTPGDIGEQWDESVLRTWHYEEKFPPDPTPGAQPWYGRMQPGDSISSYVYLEADGTFVGNHIDIYCSNVNEELDPDTDIENEAEATILGWDVPVDPNNGIYDKDTVMIITYMSYHQTVIISGDYINPAYFFLDDDDLDDDDIDDDGRISLYEFQVKGLHDLTPVPDSGTITFSMDVKFAETMKRGDDWVPVGNEYQGDRTNMTLLFALMQ